MLLLLLLKFDRGIFLKKKFTQIKCSGINSQQNKNKKNVNFSDQDFLRKYSLKLATIKRDK